MARECPQAWGPVSRVAVDPSSVPESDSVAVVSADPEELPSVDKSPVDVVAVDPVDASIVDVPVTNNSSVSEPTASETVFFKDDASSSTSTSSGLNSDILGLNGVDLFQQNLMTHREGIDQDILDKAPEDLADATSKINRDSFFEIIIWFRKICCKCF